VRGDASSRTGGGMSRRRRCVGRLLLPKSRSVGEKLSRARRGAVASGRHAVPSLAGQALLVRPLAGSRPLRLLALARRARAAHQSFRGRTVRRGRRGEGRRGRRRTRRRATRSGPARGGMGRQGETRRSTSARRARRGRRRGAQTSTRPATRATRRRGRCRSARRTGGGCSAVCG
jgi:hypothetical protein